MGKYMTFTICQKIKIHIGFILFCILAGCCGFMIEALGIGVTIVLHEMGHIFWILVFGGKVETISVSLIGGVVKASTNTIKEKWKKTLVNIGRPDYQYFNSNTPYTISARRKSCIYHSV